MSVVRPPSLTALTALREKLSARLPIRGTGKPGGGDPRSASTNPEGPEQSPVEAASLAGRGQAHTAQARGVRTLGGNLETVLLPRRAADAHDVVIAVEFCGLCHSDVHAARGEWGGRALPLVPGHEIVGRVVAVGSEVSLHAVGDRVGVGCLVASCRECDECRAGREMFCEVGSVGTYGAWDRFHDERTQGGYSTSVVVAEDFVLRIPEALDPAAAAPLLCAGITTYSPLRSAGVGPGSRVAVAGLGGLGHLAVKIAVAMGAEVSVFTTSPSKVDAALALGASDVVLSRDPEAMKAQTRHFDVIIDAIAAAHDLNALLRCLRPTGRLVQVGLPPAEDGAAQGGAGDTVAPVDSTLLVRNGLSLHGSKIGGIPETQEMLDFCAEHGVATDIEMVTAHELDAAWERMVAGDVKYRFVLDAATLTD
ncbi:NAD(P)-dependent alcohol dehydrogenase [Galactobacter caseinivorans]|uniref:alcohol dehydrogenase (NADP(+)) n=1 Tax=Galactobacter caseinivorans TaxID=2676123 RepID=A0A496PMP7_9MICC|nr:NAD(P)-dependent alcohol dehydrogenase [Galactobacter caseinivorans]RKW71820.1 NAD(P)-dependent alcohol dehydrogenase [Galactobacter caseinivorans]